MHICVHARNLYDEESIQEQFKCHNLSEITMKWEVITTANNTYLH